MFGDKAWLTIHTRGFRFRFLRTGKPFLNCLCFLHMGVFMFWSKNAKHLMIPTSWIMRICCFVLSYIWMYLGSGQLVKQNKQCKDIIIVYFLMSYRLEKYCWEPGSLFFVLGTPCLHSHSHTWKLLYNHSLICCPLSGWGLKTSQWW